MSASFQIDPERTGIPGLAPLLRALAHACDKLGIRYFVVGALARDLALQPHGIEPLRATRDVDVAVAVADWDAYEALREELVGNRGFSRGDEPQRVRAPAGPLVDLVPFGAIEREERAVRWPPEEAFVMSTLGFEEAYATALTGVLDQETSLKVASLVGLGVLKLIAWRDRCARTSKDAEDFCVLMRRYIDVVGERLYSDHADLFDDDFDNDLASARVFGREAAPVLKRSGELAEAVTGLLRQETQNALDSRFARAMGRACLGSYERRFRSLQSYARGVKEALAR